MALCCFGAQERMALFEKQLVLVTEGDLASLVENQVREGYQVEYKRSVAFKEKQDKLDFLATVTSFANTVGGDLLIGVTAMSGVPVAIPGWEGVDLDQEKLRIENLLRIKWNHVSHLTCGRSCSRTETLLCCCGYRGVGRSPTWSGWSRSTVSTTGTPQGRTS